MSLSLPWIAVARFLAVVVVVGLRAAVPALGKTTGNEWTRFKAARVNAKGSTSWTRGLQIAVLPSGDLVWLGCFSGVAAFGGRLGKTARGWSSSDNEVTTDVFVARVGKDGRPRWVRHIQGSCAREPQGEVERAAARVAVAPTGTIVVAFASKSRGRLVPLERSSSPPLPRGCADCAFVGEDDVVVSALDGEGAPVWTTRLGLAGWAEVGGLAVDSAGRSVVAATFRGKLAPTAGSPAVESNATDILIGRLGPRGHLERRTVLSGTSYETVADLAIDSAGDAVIVGNYWETLELGGRKLRASGSRDAFVAKLSSSGKARWARSFGAAAVPPRSPNDATADEERDRPLSEATAVAVSSSGDVFVAGYMEAPVDFGGGLLRVPASTQEPASRHGFVVRLDGARGGHRWSRAFPALRGMTLPAALVLEAEQPVVALNLPGPTSADLGGDRSMVSRGSSTAVLVKLDRSNGKSLRIHRVETEPFIAVVGMSFAHQGLFVTGAFQGRLHPFDATLTIATPSGAVRCVEAGALPAAKGVEPCGPQAAFLARARP